MQKYYTGIGSRETPPEIKEVMTAIGFKLAAEGWTLRSGGAYGADQAFEEGWWDWFLKQPAGSLAEPRAEIFIPWNGFEDRYHGGAAGGHIVMKDKTLLEEADDIASVIHPAWNARKPDGSPVLSKGMKTLHSRNCFQVLGQDLMTPSKFVVCYGIPQGRSVKGGTRTACELALNNNIQVFNLYLDEDRERINKWL